MKLDKSYLPVFLKKIFVLIFCGVIPFCSSYAQTVLEEQSLMVSELGLPEGSIISIAPVPGIPGKNPLRVYLAFGMDMMVRDNFIKWIENWNKKNAKKRGSLELVGTLDQADLIFGRFAVRDKKEQRVLNQVIPLPTQSTTTTNASVYGSGGYGTGQASSTTRGTQIINRSMTVDTVPIYAYILRPTNSGFEVLWRYASDTTLAGIDGKDSGHQLFKDFEKLIKDRPRI